MPRIDRTGQRFGRLVAIQDAGLATNRHRLWLCQCDCGNLTTAQGDNLQSGNTRSCGCGEQEHRFTHGQAYSPMYHMWVGMIQRCHNPNDAGYKYYGARGITVCDQWHTFENLYVYILATIGERPPGKVLDRINNDGNYEPGNIRWATHSESMKNRRKLKWRLRQSRIRNVAYIRLKHE